MKVEVTKIQARLHSTLTLDAFGTQENLSLQMKVQDGISREADATAFDEQCSDASIQRLRSHMQHPMMDGENLLH